MRYLFISITTLCFYLSVSAHTKITVGTPGTDLAITGSTASSLSALDTIEMNHGNYTGWSIIGLHKGVIITAASGGVKIDFAGTNNTALIQNSSLFQLQAPGLLFYHGNYRCLELNGNVDSCLIQCTFQNFRDYVIYNTGLTYAGTAATRNNALDIRVQIDSVSNAAMIHLTNRVNNSYIQNCRFSHLYGFAQNMCEITGKFNVIRNNFVDSVNIGGIGHAHNAIFIPIGGFDIYNNITLNSQGEDRLRPYTMDSTSSNRLDTSYYHNNFKWNSMDKYGQCEVQNFTADTAANTTSPGDVWVFNNTAGRLRDSVVDGIFLQGGSLVILEQFFAHGRIWNENAVCPRTDANQGTLNAVTNTVIYNAAGTLGLFDTSHNKFYLTIAAGKIDTTNGQLLTGAPAIDAGVTISGVGYAGESFATDAKGTSRPQGAAYDAGLDEFTSGNIPPVANAGATQAIKLPISTVTLNGSGSTDSDGTIVTYTWTRLSGPNTPTITSPTSVSTTVTGLRDGVYNFQLTVTDDLGATNSATVLVYVGLSQTLFIYLK